MRVLGLWVLGVLVRKIHQCWSEMHIRLLMMMLDLVMILVRVVLVVRVVSVVNMLGYAAGS